uniref:Transmembrane protein n=1 Tax=Cacopsylla melanoneura TaxID=428564 RepID=A0A8D9E5Q4_9HEMI
MRKPRVTHFLVTSHNTRAASFVSLPLRLSILFSLSPSPFCFPSLCVPFFPSFYLPFVFRPSLRFVSSIYLSVSSIYLRSFSLIFSFWRLLTLSSSPSNENTAVSDLPLTPPWGVLLHVSLFFLLCMLPFLLCLLPRCEFINGQS